MDTDRVPVDSVIDIAVRFVADQPGGVDRMLARHYLLPDGLCAGCVTNLTRWPCFAANLALSAQRHRRARPSGDRPTLSGP